MNILSKLILIFETETGRKSFVGDRVTNNFKRWLYFKGIINDFRVAKYPTIHVWVNENISKTGICNLCGKPEFYENLGKLVISNKTGLLIWDLNNFQWAHRSCHIKYDRENKIVHEGLSK